MLARLLASGALAAVCAMSSWAAEDAAKPKSEPSKPAPQAPQRWYSDCPGCATTLGRGGRAGPFSTVEECREKVAKLVANGYPYGFCRLEQ